MKNKKTNTNENEIDYLDEDPIICDQNWVCVSFLSTKNIKNVDKNEKYEIKGLKIRGVYNDYEEATKRAEFLRNLDPSFDIFIGEVGKWLPCDVDIEKAKDRHYAEKELNDIMKTYKEDLKCVKEMEGERKKDMLKNAKVDKDNTKKVEELRKKLDLKKKELNMESKNLLNENKANVVDKNEQMNNDNLESHEMAKDKLSKIIEEYESYNETNDAIDNETNNKTNDETNDETDDDIFKIKNIEEKLEKLKELYKTNDKTNDDMDDDTDDEILKKKNIEDKLAKLKELYEKTQIE